MTVQDLIDTLAHMPPTMRVYLSIDPEGNGFRELVDAERSPFVAGEPVHEDDAGPDSEVVLVLWP